MDIAEALRTRSRILARQASEAPHQNNPATEMLTVIMLAMSAEFAALADLAAAEPRTTDREQEK